MKTKISFQIIGDQNNITLAANNHRHYNGIGIKKVTINGKNKAMVDAEIELIDGDDVTLFSLSEKNIFRQIKAINNIQKTEIIKRDR